MADEPVAENEEAPDLDEGASEAPTVDEDQEEVETEPGIPDLDKEYASEDGEEFRKTLRSLYERIVKGWDDRREQLDGIHRYWDCYNGILNDQQAYNGNSKIYIPFVHDAVEALVQRDTSMLFPETGRVCEVTSPTGENPRAICALLDHYADLNQAAIQMPGVLRAGRVTGQRNIGVEWRQDDVKRFVRKQDSKFSFTGTVRKLFDRAKTIIGLADHAPTGYPGFYAIATEDLLVLPAGCDRIQDAEVVVEAIRASKTWIEDERRKGTFDDALAELLINRLGNLSGKRQPNPPKNRQNDAGIKDGGKYVLLFRVWTKLDLEDEDEPVPTRIYFAEPGKALSVRRNPYWCQRVPILSSPVKKVPGSFWGLSQIDPVENLAYQANDAMNMGMDSAKRTLLPIILTDPEKNPRYGSMVIAPGAVWETAPGSTQPLTMTQLWKEALEIVSFCKSQIMESMGLNQAMIPSNRSGKVSQAQVAQEQQVAIMQVNDETSRFEREILDPLLEWWYELDLQYRDDDVMIRVYGELGRDARMQKLEPEQEHRRFYFRWRGTKAFQGVQKVQQKIAMMNVLRGVPPQQMGGRTLDIGPILDQITEETFGPETARLILRDPRDQLSVDPDIENKMLQHGLPVTVHPMDNDQQHLQAHAELAAYDPTGVVALHIADHQKQLQAKNMQFAQAQKGTPGSPGGAGPGRPGMPRPGAQPGQPRPQQPAGAVHPDQMNDMVMPRRM